MNSRRLYILIVFLGVSCGFQSLFSADLYVKNDSTWSCLVKVSFVGQDEASFSLVVRPTDFFLLGSSGKLSAVSVETYGELYGRAAYKKVSFASQEILQSCSGGDCLIRIVPASFLDAAAQTLWSVIDYSRAEPEEETSPLSTPGTPQTPASPIATWKADLEVIDSQKILQELPQKQFLESVFKKYDEPRHLLGLSKEGFSDADIKQARDLRVMLARKLFAKNEASIAKVSGHIAKAANFAKKIREAESDHDKEYVLFEWQIFLNSDRIEKGRRLLCDILDTDDGYVQHMEGGDNAYLEDIINVIWYFYALSLRKGQGFSEGTFVLDDPGFKIYSFLMDYVKNVNSEVGDSFDDYPYLVSTNPYAYPRGSTHFKVLEGQSRYRHYGIDIRFKPSVTSVIKYPDATKIFDLAKTNVEDSESWLTLAGNYSARLGEWGGPAIEEDKLPVKKRHILFGKIAENRIFIKMENYGIFYAEAATHGKELVESVFRKLPPKIATLLGKVGLKDWLPEGIAQYLAGHDEDSVPNYRKERIPVHFLERCLKILQTKVQDYKEDVEDEGFVVVEQSPEVTAKEKIKEQMKLFAYKGMQHLHDIVNNPAGHKNVPGETRNLFKAYFEELKGEERFAGFSLYDHIERRYGREVIFTAEQLKAACDQKKEFVKNRGRQLVAPVKKRSLLAAREK